MSRLVRVLVGLTASLAGIVVAGGVALALFTLSLLPELPSIESIRDVPLKVPLRVYSAEGALMAEYGEERREPLSINVVPERLIQAILAAEDDAFYRHPGVDVTGIVRAALANLRKRGTEQGASTITMQVARNYFLSPEKTYTRKLKEVLLAFRLERMLTKDEILELYLNKIFLGQRAYGFAAASRVYFGKSLADLNVAEIAMLAGLPKAPSRDNPISSPDNARQRRNYVLRRMRELDHISDEEYRVANEAEIAVTGRGIETEVEAPYVAEMVRAYLVDRHGDEAYWRGFKVFTTIKGDLQHSANQALRAGLVSYDQRHGYRGKVARHEISDATTVEEMDRVLEQRPRSGDLVPAIVIGTEAKSAKLYTRDREVIDLKWPGMAWARAYVDSNTLGAKPERSRDVVSLGDIVYVQPDGDDGWRLGQLPEIAGALVSLRPDDGAILALTGGFDFYLTKFNRATQAQRQPGSNIKPFIYSAALENGFTPATLVSGAPIVVTDSADSTVWRPENYSRKFFGPTRLRKALTLSLNLVSVRILRAIGTERALRHMQVFGFERNRLSNGLSLALGAGAVTPLEMVRAYAVFANGGFRVEPYFIAWIEDVDGNVVEQANPARVCGGCIQRPAPADASAPAGAEVSPPRQAERALRADNQFLMTSMMQDVIRSGTGRRALQLGRADLAGKTGTTNDFRDAWFSGFNSQLVTTVWVGFDDPATLGRGEAGSKAALPIWVDFMAAALDGTPQQPWQAPDNVVSRYVSAQTGQATSESDPDGYQEFFIVGSEPTPAAASPLANGAHPAAGVSQPVPEGLF